MERSVCLSSSRKMTFRTVLSYENQFRAILLCFANCVAISRQARPLTTTEPTSVTQDSTDTIEHKASIYNET